MYFYLEHVLVQNSENSYTDAKNMCLFFLFWQQKQMPFLHLHAFYLWTKNSLCRYQKAPKTFIIHSKAKWSETPKQGQVLLSLYLPFHPLCLIMFIVPFIIIHNTTQFAVPNNTSLTFFFLWNKIAKDNFVHSSDIHLFLMCLILGPTPAQKGHGLMNFFCWGHGFRTLVIWAILLSMFMTKCSTKKHM